MARSPLAALSICGPRSGPSSSRQIFEPKLMKRKRPGVDSDARPFCVSLGATARRKSTGRSHKLRVKKESAHRDCSPRCAELDYRT